MFSFLFRTTSSIAVVAAALSVPSIACAQERSFNIPAQPAASGVREFGKQSGIQIVVSHQEADGRTTNAVRGNLDVHAALDALLSGTGLSVRSFDGKVAVVGAEKSADAGEPIVVTGSRIARLPTETSTPVQSFDKAEIESTGTLAMEDLFVRQPQFAGGNTSRSNNPGNGKAEIDLRGLGTGRNLVLVNGRRYVFSGSYQTTDINAIPAALVERVDVVTGGSSAVYGSDAIAGVTNFILRTDFNGVEAKLQYGGDTAGDAASRSLDITAGTNFADGRGNVVLAGNYYKRGAVTQADRAYSSIPLADGTVGGAPALISRAATSTPDGSFPMLTAAQLALLQSGAPAYAGLATALNAAGLSGLTSLGFTFDGTGSAARLFRDPDDRYNIASLNYLQVPAERKGLSGFAHFDITDRLTVYGEASWYRNVVTMQLAPANHGVAAYQFNVNNPYVSPAMQEVFHQLDLLETGANANNGLVSIRFARRFEEIGPRDVFINTDTLRVGGGLKGSLPDVGGSFLRNNRFDISYFYGEAKGTSDLTGMVSRAAYTAGLLSVDGAAPLVNPFGFGMSDAAIEALTINTHNRSFSSLHTAMGTLSSDVAPLPAGPLSVALGVEWRKAHDESNPDPAQQSGDAIGQDPFYPTSGGIEVFELFGEMRLPLLSEDSAIGRVTANGAARYSHYDLTGARNVWTWLSGLEWSPVPGLNLRGQWQHAVRAPNIGELFSGQYSDSPSVQDTCALPSAATNAAVRAVCIATGVPESMVGNAALQSSSRVDVLYGSNPDLKPESSNTLSFGFTLQPVALPGFSLKVDYFNIEVKDAIAPLGATVAGIFDLCYNVLQDPNSALCQAIRRDPADGRIGSPYSVQAFNTNIGKITTSGIDFGIGWGHEFRAGRLGFDLRGTWLHSYNVTPLQDLPDQVSHCAGTFGAICGYEVRPKIKTVTRVGWSTGGFAATLQHRFIGSVTDDRIVVGGGSKADYAVPVLGSRSYFDLSASYKVARTGVTIYGGVNNVFDTYPVPIGSSQQQANTFPSTYDALGAEYFVGLKVRF
jgi:iron complex outermembrane receptor protein